MADDADLDDGDRLNRGTRSAHAEGPSARTAHLNKMGIASPAVATAEAGLEGAEGDGDAEEEQAGEGDQEPGDGPAAETATDTGTDHAATDDPELEAMRQRVREMEEEARKLHEMQSELQKSTEQAGLASSSGASKEDMDQRSVFVGNVDYAVTPEELKSHFSACGAIIRATILTDRITNRPKGCGVARARARPYRRPLTAPLRSNAYIEFAAKESVDNALAMNETMLHGRQLKVIAKRTNIPGYFAGGRRGRFRRGRGTFRGGYRGRWAGRRARFTPY